MPRVGEEYRVGVQLDPADTGLFPRAILIDATGAVLPESPVDLSHTVDGVYNSPALAFPNSPLVRASITIYEDAARTIEADYERAAECFEKTPDPVLTRTVFAADLDLEVATEEELEMSVKTLELDHNVQVIGEVEIEVSVLETGIDVSIMEIDC